MTLYKYLRITLILKTFYFIPLQVPPYLVKTEQHDFSLSQLTQERSEGKSGKLSNDR